MAPADDDGEAAAPASSDQVSQPSETETYVLALGALASGVMTLLFDDHGLWTVTLTTLALVPWALLVGRVRLPTWLFVVWVAVPASLVVVLEQAGGSLFLGILLVTRVFSTSRSWLVLTATSLVAVAMTGLLYVSEVAVEDDPVTFDDVGAQYFLTGVAVCACCGYLFRRQRELTAQLQWSRAQLDAAAAAEERRRIAREVHDVVAHSLTVVLLNVTGARKALASQPDQAAAALDRAESVGRESLDGIRRVVGLLRSAGPSAEDAVAPLPTAAELPTLVDQQRAAGASVAMEVTGDLTDLDQLTGAAVVRVVQEALTNAQRHAPGAPIDLRLRVDDDQVAVAVRNGAAAGRSLDAPSTRRGLGLVGMRERVEGLGGRFSAGPCSPAPAADGPDGAAAARPAVAAAAAAAAAGSVSAAVAPSGEDGGWLVEAVLPRGPHALAAAGRTGRTGDRRRGAT
jgi:signal transduction histidine kinase